MRKYRKKIAYFYSETVHLKSNKINKDVPLSIKFLPNLKSILENKKYAVINHSHVTGKMLGFAHEFCNQKVKENYYTIPALAHSQFRLDFFLLLKGLRPTVWGRNPSNVNFVMIRDQVKFIDTVKYFQQSLSSIAKSMTDKERENIRKTCRNFILDKLQFLSEEVEKWVLHYLC